MEMGNWSVRLGGWVGWGWVIDVGVVVVDLVGVISVYPVVPFVSLVCSPFVFAGTLIDGHLPCYQYLVLRTHTFEVIFSSKCTLRYNITT